MESEKIQTSVKYLLTKTNRAKIAIVLGSGLASLVKYVTNKRVIKYQNIPGFLVTTAPDHKGELIFGNIEDVPVILLNGRFHYYEGYEIKEVVRYVPILKAIGVETLLLSNASGSTSSDYRPGDLVIITDHLNLSGVNPLRGINDEAQGPRFVSTANCYNQKNITLLQEASANISLKIKTGIYAYTLGPSFETGAEIQAFKNLGANLVGMSTVPEVIAARYNDLEVNAVSLVTNFGTGITGLDSNHQEFSATTKNQDYQQKFAQLIINFLQLKYDKS